mmetsp:Transcript_8526/g.13438  ORF Transcript_8526/g.13438 Transcript_8526/m.13438 type:complete len:88 (-) Transcript_8526:151-414(-)
MGPMAQDWNGEFDPEESNRISTSNFNGIALAPAQEAFESANSIMDQIDALRKMLSEKRRRLAKNQETNILNAQRIMNNRNLLTPIPF